MDKEIKEAFDDINFSIDKIEDQYSNLILNLDSYSMNMTNKEIFDEIEAFRNNTKNINYRISEIQKFIEEHS